MSKKDIFVVGAGGFAKEVVWLIEENNKVNDEWNILGYIDKDASENINGYEVKAQQWLMEYNKPINVVLAIGSPQIKKKIYTQLKENPNISYPTLISHRTNISDKVTFGKGCIICAGVQITVDIQVGNFVTLNLGCTVGHDTKICDYVVAHPRTIVSGNVVIGEQTLMGTGSMVIQEVTIGNNNIIGAGTVIIRDIGDNSTVVGNPGKVIKTH